MGWVMARLILGTKPIQTTVVNPVHIFAGNRLSPQSLQARLRQKRSARYIDAMTQLDAGGHVHSTAANQALQDAIQQELPDVTVDALPLGVVSKCYLGAPYEVHTLDCTGGIVKHFKCGETLSPLMERARSLANHPTYAFIEVYSTKLIAVSASGQTAIIEA